MERSCRRLPSHPLKVCDFPRRPPYLYVSRQAHILDDDQGGRGWLEKTSPFNGFRRIAPRLLWRLRPLIEIGEKNSLRRELSAGYSEGK